MIIRGQLHLGAIAGCPERQPGWCRQLGLGWFLVLATLWTTGCRRTTAPEDLPRIATTTSYLETVTRDLAGDTFGILRLAEPGSCPGHFDLRPSQVSGLRHCRLLLRFDFQRSLDARLREIPDLAVGEIAPGGGMNLPASYFAACGQTARHLVDHGLLSPSAATSRLETIQARLDALASAQAKRVAATGTAAPRVIASAHQRDFCVWLGLEVVAVFRAADTVGVHEIEEALTAGRLGSVRLIIANQPEGRRLADALAARLAARVVVFENFPDPRDGALGYDAMVRRNVEALLSTLKP